MAFFPRTSHTAQGFHPLFRLLDDFDTYSRQNVPTNGSSRSGRALPTFQPKFDVRETATSFELHGELPGLSKEDVQIEFTDPHTMLIRGRIERSYTSGNPDALEDTKTAGAIEGADKTAQLQATVEDDEDDDESSAGQRTPATVSAEVAKPETKPVDKAKYWVSERSIGEFSRSFNFPGHLQQDAVSASLKDGILNVVVPKAKKPESFRIAIN